VVHTWLDGALRYVRLWTNLYLTKWRIFTPARTSQVAHFCSGVWCGFSPTLTARTKEPLTETFVFRCAVAEKAQLRAKAEAAGLPAATLLRQALGLTEARRRKPIPRVDPALVLAVGRIGGNLNRIARWLNRAMLAGRVDLDALTVARRLLSIER